MPQIKPYQSRIDIPGPFQQHRQTGALNAGVGVEALGQGIEKAGDYLEKRQEQDEISKLNATMSQQYSDFTTSWQKQLQTADPNDPHLAENFVKQFDDSMSKVQDGIQTHAGDLHFQEKAAQLREHFVTTAAEGQAHLAGVAAVQNYTTMKNNLSSGLINDPSSFDLAKNLHEAGLRNLVQSGAMPSDVAQKLNTEGLKELAKSAVRGWIKNDPNAGQEQLDSGRWNNLIDGDAKHQLYGEVKIAKDAQETEQRKKDADAQRILGQQQMQTQDQFLAKMANHELSTKDVLNSNLDPFGSGSKEQFIGLLDKSIQGRIKTDPAVFKDLWDRTHLPEGDPRRITDENDLNPYMGRGLTVGDVQTLRAEVQGKRTASGAAEADVKNSFIKLAESKIVKANPMLGIRDPDGQERMTNFLSIALPSIDKQRKAGKSMAEILDDKNPDNPKKLLDQFIRSPQEIMQSMTKGFSQNEGLAATNPTAAPSSAPAKAPRNPGESAADYLKRVGK